MKHKFFSKRGFALFVSLMMCVNALSVTAWAGSFSQLQDLIKDGGDVTLKENYAYETSDGNTDSITVSKTVNLNLNGYTITGSGKDSVIKVENGGNLTLRDEATDGAKEGGTGTITSKDSDTRLPDFGGGIYVGSNSTFTMEGGLITGNKVGGDTNSVKAGGAGVFVDNGGTFTMKGGEISHNTSGGSGAGVFVNGDKGNLNDHGTFFMNGGKIANNTSTASNSSGGGVFGKFHASITMTGGEITGNSAQKDSSGVYLWNASFSMTGGNVYGNGVASGAKKDISSATGDGHKDHAGDVPVITGGTIATADEGFIPVGTCRTTNGDGTTTVGHIVVTDEAVPATCGRDGLSEGRHCSTCDEVFVAQTAVDATGNHSFGEWVVDGTTRTRTCSVCGEIETEEVETPAEDPVVTIPDVELPLADLPGETAEIADEEVPLAGLVSLAQLLDALYRHEDSPAVELPEEFPFAEHDYAAAICWGLDNALVLSTEEEPLDPDEIITVALLREVLENFVAYKGVELTVTVDGEDDELVMDLGDRLNAFFQLLDEAAA